MVSIWTVATPVLQQQHVNNAPLPVIYYMILMILKQFLYSVFEKLPFLSFQVHVYQCIYDKCMMYILIGKFQLYRLKKIGSAQIINQSL